MLKAAVTAFVIGILLVPSLGSGLIQSGTSFGTSQAAGFTDTNTSMGLRATVNGAGNCYLEVEVKPLGTAFAGTGTLTSPATASGSVAEVGVILPATPPIQGYHWQARVTDDDGSTAWGSFGANLETDADFTIDLTPPVPFGLQQATTSFGGNTPGFTDTNTAVYLRAFYTDVDFENAFIELEVRAVGVAYTGVPTATSPMTPSGGNYQFALVMPSTPMIESYRWRARTRNALTNFLSAWVEYGGNPTGDPDYTIDLTPPVPFGLQQATTSFGGNTPGFTDTNTAVYLRAFYTDVDFENAFIELEVRAVGVAYTGVPTATSPMTPSGGNYQFALVMPSTPMIESYRWRARTRNALTNFLSAWVEYGGNPTGDPDYTIDLTPPVPFGLQQATTSFGGNTPGFTDTNTAVYLRAFYTDVDFENAFIELEVRAVGVAYTGVPTATSPMTPSGGNYQFALVMPSTPMIESYRWRARTRNALTNFLSAWVEYGGNPTGDPDYTIDLTPPVPFGLQQATTSFGGNTPGFTDTNTAVYLRAFYTDVDFENAFIELEVRAVGVAYTGVPTATSPMTPSGGNYQFALVMPSTPMIESYRWRARTRNALTNFLSAWVEYGGNPTGDPDYTIDLTPPVPTGLIQAATAGGAAEPAGYVSTSDTLYFRATATDPDGETWGLEVDAGLTPAFPGTFVVVGAQGASGTELEVTITGLTNGGYHWRARSVSAAGYTSAWVSFGANPETDADFSVSVSPPPDPAGLLQASASAGAAELVGFSDADGVVFFRATVTNSGAPVKLQLEVKPVWVAFDGTVTTESGFVASGTEAEASLTIFGDGAFHWRARASGGLLVSGWVSFGANLESEADFYRDTLEPDSIVTTTGLKSPVTWLGTIQGTASDVTTGPASIDVRIQRLSDSQYWNGASWVGVALFLPATGTTTWSYAFAPVDGETYTVSSRATDGGGTLETTFGTNTFTYDAAEPDSIVTTSGAQDSSTWTGAIVGTASDTTSGIANVRITVRWVEMNLYWNGTTWQAAPFALATTGGAAWSTSFVPGNAQSYDVASTATDVAGNIETTAGVATFTYNVSGPDSAVLTTGAFGPLTWPGAIDGSATTTAGATVLLVEIRIQRSSDGFFWDGVGWGASAFVPVTGTTTWTYSFAPADGETYTVASRATDDFANVELTFGTGTFTFGAVAPTTVITTSGLYTPATYSGAIEGTASGGTGGIALVEMRIQRAGDGLWWDGAAWVVSAVDLAAAGTTTWLYAFAAAEGEVYTVTVRATDGAGIVQDPPSVGAFGIGAAPIVARKARYHFKCAAGAEAGSPWLVVLFAALATAATARRRSTRSR